MNTKRLVVFIQTSFDAAEKSRSIFISQFEPLKDDVTLFVLRGDRDMVAGKTIFYQDQYFAFSCLAHWIAHSRVTLILTDEDMAHWTQKNISESASVANNILELDPTIAQVCFSSNLQNTCIRQIGPYEVSTPQQNEPEWWGPRHVLDLVTPIHAIQFKEQFPKNNEPSIDYSALALGQDLSIMSVRIEPSLFRSTALLLIIDSLRINRPSLSINGLHLARAGFSICALRNGVEEHKRAFFCADQVTKNQLTVVTGFLEIPVPRNAKRPSQNYNYFEHCSPTLSLRHPMVVFGSTTACNLAKNIRSKAGLLEKTICIEIGIEDLERFEDFEMLKIASEKNISPYNNPQFIVAVNARYELLNKAVSSNFFNTTHFAWLDFSASHIVKFPEDNILTPEVDDRIRAAWIARFNRQKKTFLFNHKAIAGGLLIGHKETIPELTSQHRQSFNKLLSLGHCINDDRLLFAMLEQNPQLFHSSVCGYRSVIERLSRPLTIEN